MEGPLSDIRVVEVANFVAAPSAGVVGPSSLDEPDDERPAPEQAERSAPAGASIASG